MDQRPVARRTRARTEALLLERYRKTFHKKPRTGESASESHHESVNDSDGLKLSGEGAKKDENKAASDGDGSSTMPIKLDGSDSDGEGAVVCRGEKDPDDMEGKDVICLDDEEDELGENSSRLSNTNVVENGSPDPVPTPTAVPQSSSGDDDDRKEDVSLQKYSQEDPFVESSGDEEDVESEDDEEEEEEDDKDDGDYNGSASCEEGEEDDTDSSSEEAVMEHSGGSHAPKRGGAEVETPKKFEFLSSSSSLSNSVNEDDEFDFPVKAREAAKGTKDNEVSSTKDKEVVKHSSVDSAYSARKRKRTNVAGQTKLKPRHHHAAERTELGTADNPFYIGLDDVGASDELEDGDDDDEEDSFIDDDDDEMEHRVNKKSAKKKPDGAKQQTDFSREKVKFHKLKKKGRDKVDIEQIILNSILDGEDLPFDDGLLSKDEVRVENISDSEYEALYPLKFYFGNEPKPPPEPTDMDKLWSEMGFALASSAMSSNGKCVDDEEDEIPTEVKQDQLTCCARGKHHFILDEEVGIVCKYCSYVQVEIRYVVSSFGKNPSERYRRGSRFEDYLRDGDLPFGDQRIDPESTFVSPPCKAEGTVWDLVPGVKNSMYPHQREGFEFIWKNVAGGIDLAQLKEQSVSDSGNGCIISHAAGTGKTRLAIVFVQSYLRMYPDCRPVIVAPANMLLTWEEEFKKWKTGIHFHNLNNSVLSGKEVLLLKDNSESVIRDVKLHTWSRGGSVLGISYHLFKLLVGVNKTGKKKTSGRKDEQIRRILLEFPGLLIMDEGHIPRNEDSDVFRALSEVHTEKKISMSGTPFQNNFDELFNTLSFVRPKFAGGMRGQQSRQDSAFVMKRGRRRKEEREKWTHLTSAIGKKADDRQVDEQKLNQVRALLAPFVHVHKGTVLQDSLPGLRQSVVVLRPFPLQNQLIEAIEGGEGDMVSKNHSISLVAAHPSLFLGLSKTLQEKLKGKVGHLTAELESSRLNPEYGAKMKFIMELLRLSEALNEKVLIFSEYLKPLKLIRDQVRFSYNWVDGREVLYMDGKQDVQLRQSSINSFNDPSNEVKVLLASKAACSEGINLIGASRLVLLDVSWNPSRDSQAISRAFRLGQKKFVHVYRLVTLGTMEEDKCCRQAKKDWLSRSVFFTPDGECSNARQTPLKSMEDKILEELQHHDKMKYIDKIEEYDESKLMESLGLGL